MGLICLNNLIENSENYSKKFLEFSANFIRNNSIHYLSSDIYHDYSSEFTLKYSYRLLI